MPGRRLVQRERFHAVDRLRFQVVGVDVEDAGPRAVGRAAGIRSARGGSGTERLHLAYLVIRFRHHRKKPRQLGVELALDAPVAGQEIRGIGEIKRGFLLHVAEELHERALEADFPHHLFHARADARDFREADCVDLARRHRGRGLVAHFARVPGLAVRKRVPADGIAAGRQVFVADEPGEAPEGGIQLVLDQHPIAAFQPLALGKRPFGRDQRDRPEENARLLVGRDQRLELRHQLRHHDPRMDHALRHALAHRRDRAVDPARELARAREPAVVIRDARERLRPAAGAEQRDHGETPASNWLIGSRRFGCGCARACHRGCRGTSRASVARPRRASPDRWRRPDPGSATRGRASPPRIRATRSSPAGRRSGCRRSRSRARGSARATGRSTPRPDAGGGFRRLAWRGGAGLQGTAAATGNSRRSGRFACGSPVAGANHDGVSAGREVRA